jgi:hypothetical protein
MTDKLLLVIAETDNKAFEKLCGYYLDQGYAVSSSNCTTLTTIPLGDTIPYYQAILMRELESEMVRLKKELEKEKESKTRYRNKIELLQSEQKNFREPERTIVCDIIANGFLLPDPDGTRYGGSEDLRITLLKEE